MLLDPILDDLGAVPNVAQVPVDAIDERLADHNSRPAVTRTSPVPRGTIARLACAEAAGMREMDEAEN